MTALIERIAVSTNQGTEWVDAVRFEHIGEQMAVHVELHSLAQNITVTHIGRGLRFAKIGLDAFVANPTLNVIDLAKKAIDARVEKVAIEAVRAKIAEAPEFNPEPEQP